MSNLETSKRNGRQAVSRVALAAGVLMVAIGLAGCTTVEGTNALVDPATFERDVMTETLTGLGVIDRQQKPPLDQPRAPLAMPKNTDVLPPPTKEDTSMLPENSDKVKIDTTGLTQEDLNRLRNAKVVDLNTISGRPLTDEEARKLTARMKAYRVGKDRPLYLPPESYFTTVNGQDLICLANNGDLVPLTDPNCPQDIKDALQQSKS
ncbi:MAG TPA: hypothetical protein VIL84_03280 [Devosiaceae bacterium]